MKKIVGILGMAAMLGSAAFAAEPAANFVMSEFKGSAEFGVKGNFIPDDPTFGMYNDHSASIAFGFVTAGDKVTTGDGVWGELKISAKQADPLKFPNLGAASVDVAKIHLMSGNFEAALNIIEPKLKVAGVNAPAATGATVGTSEIDVTGALKNGFGLELKLVDLFSMNVNFMDKGSTVAMKDQNYGISADFALDANLVPGLSFNAAVASNFETKETAFGVSAGYKLNVTDKMYVNPGVAFNMDKADKKDAVNGLEAGLLFGWGAAGIDPGMAYVSKDAAEGISVGFGTDLKDAKKLVIGLYDQSLLSLVGEAEKVGTLQTGAVVTMDLNASSTVLGAGVKYNITINPVYVNLGFDYQMTKAKDVDAVNAWAAKARLGSKTVIDNVDLYAEYNVANTTGGEKITDNNITIGAKMAL